MLCKNLLKYYHEQVALNFIKQEENGHDGNFTRKRAGKGTAYS